MIEWLPWGADAFARAAREGKPVLLSITAAWCRACHEMDRTTYADPGVAALIRDADIDGGKLSKRSAKFTDYYVATKYVFSVEGQARAECWGAFTRFLCLKPGGTTKVEMPAVSAGSPPS